MMKSKTMYQYNLGISFATIVDRFPNKLALKLPALNEFLTYSELNNHSNRLARYLINCGIKQKDVVCIAGKKSTLTYICILACLKIGAIYSVLDPNTPIERLKKILSICQPKLLFLDNKLAGLFNRIDIETTVLKHDLEIISKESSTFSSNNLEETKRVVGTTPAYIMFTSGSTGFPKGAVITHANVLNFIAWNIETFKVTPDDILTNVNSLYFDNSVFDIYTAFFSGSTLISFTKAEVTDPELLLDLLDKHKCTSWFSVPSLLIYLQNMRALRKNKLTHLKRFIFGGEGYPKAKLKELYDLYGDRITFYNVYGPTECACMCSAYIISKNDLKDLYGFAPLGQIALNFDYLILDGNEKIVSEGEVGELCLLGPNVGLGYYNDPERTSMSFVQNPSNKIYKEIMYKTGDLVLYNPYDNNIYIKGRKDYQIKHMGYRIELEEIENALNQLDYVDQAAGIHVVRNNLSKIFNNICNLLS